MTVQTPYERNKAKAELIDELNKVIAMQLSLQMDWVRSRAYWETRLPELDPALLAEALTAALSVAATEIYHQKRDIA